VSRATAKLVHVSARNDELSSARRPRALPKRLMMLFAVVMNAVVVAEPESVDAALIAEVTMFVYIAIPDVGSKNCAIDPIMTKPLLMRVII
jgi:hypothetical protein